tara:strand:+ start:85 stop:537 length:453 start_codon:yes stop_codon:yes gene_type:complete
MAYGMKQLGAKSDGLLSLIQNFTNNDKGAVSDKEFKSFMDTDTGTEHHNAIATLNAPNLARNEANHKSMLAGVGISPIDANMSVAELQSQFARILGAISEPEQAQVINAFSRSDDDGKMNLMKMIVSNPAMATGYGIQDEQPVRNLGMGY